MEEGLKKVMPVANARPVKNKNNVMITIVIFITPCRAMAWQIANESKQLQQKFTAKWQTHLGEDPMVAYRFKWFLQCPCEP